MSEHMQKMQKLIINYIKFMVNKGRSKLIVHSIIGLRSPHREKV